eukprot:12900916-Prorocentrum_lima.AAC.1
MPTQSTRGELENGRGNQGRSISTSPSAQTGPRGPVYTMLTVEGEDQSAGPDISGQEIGLTSGGFYDSCVG